MPTYKGFTCSLHMVVKNQIWNSPKPSRPVIEQETIIDTAESTVTTYAAATANRFGVQIVGSVDGADFVTV